MFNSVRSFSSTPNVLRVAYKLPKKPWVLFFNDHSLEFKAQNPTMNIQQVMTALGAQWKQDEAIKAQYTKLYQEKFDAYKNKDLEFKYVVKPLLPFESFAKKNAAAVQQELGLTKKSEIRSLLKERWNAIPELERHELLKKYRSAMRKYKRDTDPNYVKQPLTSFALFFKEQTQTGKYKGLKAPEMIKTAAEEWRQLSEFEKEIYESQSAELHDQYRSSIANKVTRPPSRYNLFVKENFASIKDANPDMESKDILLLVAAKWQDEK